MDMKNNKLVWVVAIMLGFNVFGLFMTRIVADMAADRAIEKLQMEYSPAKPPYGPGLNPDRIYIDRRRPQYDDRNMPQNVRHQINMTQARDALWRHSN